MEELTGRVAVVTGGASGIGLALARRFGAAGMRVAVGDVEQETLAAAVHTLRSDGIDAIGIGTDVRDPASVDALRDEALDAFGAIHVVCNNAGVLAAGLAWDLSPAQWDWVIGVNLLGVANGIRSFVPGLIAQGEGHVVNTSSAAGLTTTPMGGSYNASKAAVVALTETLFHDLHAVGASGVGVSVLCPSFVSTRIVDSDRNAPGAFKAEWDPSSERVRQLEEMRDLWRGLLATGMDPDEVADDVVEAIRNNRFYIITHEETRSRARERFQHILDDGEPAVGMG